MRDTVHTEHAALTRRLCVDEHGLALARELLLQPVNTMFELSSSLGRRCYSCATTNVPVLKYFTLLCYHATVSEFSIAFCEDCVNRHTGREFFGPIDHKSSKSVESYNKTCATNRDVMKTDSASNESIVYNSTNWIQQ